MLIWLFDKIYTHTPKNPSGTHVPMNISDFQEQISVANLGSRLSFLDPTNPFFFFFGKKRFGVFKFQICLTKYGLIVGTTFISLSH